MKRLDFLYGMDSPLPNAVLKKWPHGNIMQYWGENPHLYSSRSTDPLHTFLGGHMGVDIATFHRDPVYAAHDGRIQKLDTDRMAPGGLAVWLEGPRVDDEEPRNSIAVTNYSHLDQIAVVQDQVVKKGDLIGYEGNTGFVVSGGTQYWGNAPAGKGTHLHFGLYELMLKDGYWQPRFVNVLKNSSDPLPYITETPENPHGHMGGLTVVLNNMLRYLNRSS